MRNHSHFLFFTEQVTGTTVILDNSETNHAVKVLRLKNGDTFDVTDGRGTRMTCKLDDISNHQAYGTIVDQRKYEPIFSKIHLNIGLPDREALELALVECTALGVNRITPIICEFCQDPWWKKAWPKYAERFKNKMIAAMKQCLYPFLPQLDQPVSLESTLKNCSEIKVVADPDGKPFRENQQLKDNRHIACFIGPPGGFSENELLNLKENGAQFVNIAPTRLRTELAATVLCSQIIGMQNN